VSEIRGAGRAIACAGALVLAAMGARAAENPTADPLAGGAGNPPLALLRADNMIYDPKTETVSAQGHVEIDYKGEHLSADRVSYDQKADRVTAEGHITIISKDGGVVFADTAELTDSLREGLIRKVRVLFGKNARIAANSAVRHKEIATVFTKAVYSPCNVCKEHPEKPPLWQLKARRVIHDKVDKEVYYRDATMEVLGIPVAWTPYFSHPDPTVKRRSGFLSPSFGTSSVLGTFLRLPYYWAISDSNDATITPTLESKDGLHLRAEYRQRLTNGQFTIDSSIVNTAKINDLNQRTGGDELRGHLFADGSFNIDPVWNWGFNIQEATDDTYLRRYGISGLDRLENHVYLLGIQDRDFFSADAFAFRDLRTGQALGESPVVAPSLQGAYNFEPGGLGGLVKLSGSFLSLYHTEGGTVQRLSGTMDWERRFTLPFGQVLTGFASTRADLYVSHDVNTTGVAGASTLNSTQGRVLPQAGFEWRWPFVRKFGNVEHVIEPIVQFVWAPKGGNSAAIPNEDSVSLEFDESNLFSRDRYPGLDLWEDGPRLNYGVRTAIYWGKGSSAQFVIGQSHRFLQQSPFAAGTGLERQDSDIVGAISIRPLRYLELTHRFRLNNGTLDYQRNETGLNLFFWRFTAGVSYTSITGADTTLVSNSLRAASASGQVKLSDRWTVSAATQYDLTNNRSVFRQVGVGYLNECISFNVLYRQDYTTDRDIRPNSSLIFQIRLVNLG
jgi:LPS-assembly protein